MSYRKLGRDSSARRALLRSIVTSLFQYERIETTEAKAKEQTSDSQPKVLNDEDFSNPGEVAGSEVWSMSKNILSGANFKKYDYPQILEGTQMQYASGQCIRNSSAANSLNRSQRRQWRAKLRA